MSNLPLYSFTDVFNEIDSFVRTFNKQVCVFFSPEAEDNFGNLHGRKFILEPRAGVVAGTDKQVMGIFIHELVGEEEEPVESYRLSLTTGPGNNTKEVIAVIVNPVTALDAGELELLLSLGKEHVTSLKEEMNSDKTLH